MMETLDKTVSKPFETEPMGFEDKINYPMLYHSLFAQLNVMHSDGRHSEAISHFYMMLPFFGGVFDKPFIINCIHIKEEHKSVNERYMLIKVEFARLMVRAGIAPKPDIRIRYKAPWNVPKEFKDMSFDGKDKTAKTESLKEIVSEVLSHDQDR